MPIIVDPSFTPTPVTTATSSDGFLTAILDPLHAGVRLKADFSALGTRPLKVQFLRDGTPVRSGDLAWAPGGIAVAYDHEAPLGVALSWTAVPVNADGSTGTPSSAATLSMPNPTPGTAGSWLKSTLAAGLSRTVWVETPMQMSLGGRVSLSPVIGAAHPAGSWDARLGYVTTLNLVTQTAQQAVDLAALLDSGPLLYQTGTGSDQPDFYFIPGDVTWKRVSTSTDPTRRWTVGVTQIDRPATVDAPLMIPGLSYDTVAATYASYSALSSAVPSYLALLGF